MTIFLQVTWKNMEKSQSAPWLRAHCCVTRADLVYVSTCESTEVCMCLGLCVSTILPSVFFLFLF